MVVGLQPAGKSVRRLFREGHSFACPNSRLPPLSGPPQSPRGSELPQEQFPTSSPRSSALAIDQCLIRGAMAPSQRAPSRPQHAVRYPWPLPTATEPTARARSEPPYPAPVWAGSGFSRPTANPAIRRSGCPLRHPPLGGRHRKFPAGRRRIRPDAECRGIRWSYPQSSHLTALTNIDPSALTMSSRVAWGRWSDSRPRRPTTQVAMAGRIAGHRVRTRAMLPIPDDNVQLPSTSRRRGRSKWDW
jgi:hypothetical protein